MNYKKQLQSLENNIDTSILEFKDEDGFFPLEFMLLPHYLDDKYFQLKGEILKELNNHRKIEDKMKILTKLKEMYLSQRKLGKKFYKNLIEKRMKFKICTNNGYIIKNCSNLSEGDLNHAIYSFQSNISKINQEIHFIRNYPHLYTYDNRGYIGPYSVSTDLNNNFSYKNISIQSSPDYDVMHINGSREEKENQKNITTLLGVLAFFNANPFFMFTGNYQFNGRLNKLYAQFDLLELIKLRNKNFFKENLDEPFEDLTPIFNTKNKYDIIHFETIEHYRIFELYHASLKQIEPIARCVFLFRVFEYGRNFHYQKLFNHKDIKNEEVIEWYIEKVKNHNFNPIYFTDFGTYIDRKNDSVRQMRKPQVRNLITILKKEIEKIKNEWKTHNFLKNKTIGEAIYGTGRNAAAHQGGKHFARYDYSSNYLHINDVNIFLELIARYIIETLNPQLINMVERKKRIYVDYKQYNNFID